MNIQEIARLAGVSISTVSKVMNGKADDISEPTRKRVLKVIEENNYIPYAKYRKKEGLKSGLIGLLVRRNNKHGHELIMSAEEILKRRGYQLLIRMTDDTETLDDAVKQMQKRNVSGMLIDAAECIFHPDEQYKTVYLSDTHQFDPSQKNTFYYQKSEAGRQIAKMLLERGHRTVGAVFLEQDREILHGIEEVYREQTPSRQRMNYYVGESLEDIRRNAMQLCIAEDVTALICGNADIMGCVVEYAEQSGIQIPDDLSCVCAEDEKILECLSCGITAVRFPIRQMTEDAAGHLLDLIEQMRESEMIRKYIPELIERNSVKARSSEDDKVKIVIVGSMNMDNLIEGEQIPMNGQTQIAKSIICTAGGKGGNQAVGVARLGGNAYMIGRIGKDADGRVLYRSLGSCGVNLEGVEFDESAASGKAFIHIDQNGENTIVVYRGANANLDSHQLKRYEMIFRKSRFCLLSSEISKETIAAAIKFCKETETKIVLKPSAIEEPEEKILNGVDYLIPNEKELGKIIIGDQTLEEKAENLLNVGVENVIVTLGKQGAYLRNRKYNLYFPSAPFHSVDTTGGADSFISALASALSEEKDLIYSIIFAMYAAGITVTRYGVQEAMPDKNTISIYREEIDTRYQRMMKEISIPWRSEVPGGVFYQDS